MDTDKTNGRESVMKYHQNSRLLDHQLVQSMKSTFECKPGHSPGQQVAAELGHEPSNCHHQNDRVPSVRMIGTECTVDIHPMNRHRADILPVDHEQWGPAYRQIAWCRRWVMSTMNLSAGKRKMDRMSECVVFH